MSLRRRIGSDSRGLATLLAVAAALGACNSTKGSDSQTNWLCESNADCAVHGSDLVCLQGECVASNATKPDGASPGNGDGGGGTTSRDGGSGVSALSATAPLELKLGRAANLSGGTEADVINFLPPRCASRAFATCVVIDCRVDRNDAGLFGLTGVSAGVITISGGTGGDVVLTPDRFGVYAASTGASWRAGDVFQITAAGDTAPAFSGTITLLPPLTLTSPAQIPGKAPLPSFRRATGLPLAWQPTDQTVTAGVTVKGQGGGTWDQIEGYCDFSGATGTATLPPELFLDFPSGAAVLYAGHSQVKTLQAGTHPVRLLSNHGTAGLQFTLL